MKKLITLVSLYIISSGIVNAQDKMRFGFEFTPFIAWLSSDIKTVESNGSHLGFNIVANGEYKFSENYAIRLGLGLSFGQGGTLIHNEFTGKGNLFPNSKLSDPSLFALDPGVQVKYYLNYIDIPFALKMATPEYGHIKYFAEIPTFTLGFKTGGRADIGDAEDENITKDVVLINLSWGVGLGIEYSLNSTTSLITGIYYHHGFSDVTSDDGSDTNKASSRRVALRLGILF